MRCNQMGFPYVSVIIDVEGTEYSLGNNSQELNNRTNSELALSNCEARMTEATLEYPVGIIRENRKSRYKQLTVLFQTTPFWAIYKNMKLPAIPTKNNICLNTVPGTNIGKGDILSRTRARSTRTLGNIRIGMNTTPWERDNRGTKG